MEDICPNVFGEIVCFNEGDDYSYLIKVDMDNVYPRFEKCHINDRFSVQRILSYDKEEKLAHCAPNRFGVDNTYYQFDKGGPTKDYVWIKSRTSGSTQPYPRVWGDVVHIGKVVIIKATIDFEWSRGQMVIAQTLPGALLSYDKETELAHIQIRE
jgi:hypothetical protein